MSREELSERVARLDVTTDRTKRGRNVVERGGRVMSFPLASEPNRGDIAETLHEFVDPASTLHTDGAANDLPDPENVRNYLISSTQHAGPGAVNSLGVCQQFANSTDQNPGLRALWLRLRPGE